MHFSRHLLKRLEIKGVNFAEVTLHVGLGTFRPVEVEDLSKHKMESEQISISETACNTVNKALKEKFTRNNSNCITCSKKESFR